ncbi:hypothetical protein GCM10009117_20710 [Gangjinia marincola]|uniref:DUF2147 domain-containing protein n=1 Tax=Gangjinia marincola TaxID=578463 RepID=A0ABN1MI91_9FLAO
MKTLITTVLLSLISFSFTTKNQDDILSGEWLITIDSPRGEKTTEIIILRDEHGNYTGKEKESYFDIIVSNEGQVSFDRMVSTPMGKMKMKFDGILKNNKMSGTCKVLSGIMKNKTMDWQASKKK